MNGKFFSKSLKFLIVVTLIALVFFRDPKYQWYLLAVYGIWFAVVLIRFIAGRIAWLGRILGRAIKSIAVTYRKAKAGLENAKEETEPQSKSQPEPNISADKLLLSHLSCRITDKLKAVFPDVAWQWQDANPERIARGGTGRIRIEDADEYTHADVTVDSYFRISFAMMKIVSLQDAADESGVPETAAETERPVQANVADWYEWVGKEVLHEVITELNTRGYSRVFIKETGEVYVVEEGNETVKATLKEMPGKSKWEEIVSVLAANELKGIIDNDRLSVSWA